MSVINNYNMEEIGQLLHIILAAVIICMTTRGDTVKLAVHEY